MRALICLMVGLLAGAAIWWISPHFTGEIEAWDDKSFYTTSLFLAGIIASLPSPPHFKMATLGIYVGQFLYMFLFLPLGPLWIIGMMIAIGPLMLSLSGGIIVYKLYRLLWQKQG